MMDVMRLPLGILSGMGFIGGGVILKRENLVLGVTTAATLWFVTVLGLCFGGGQIALGIIAFLLGILVLHFLKTLEMKIRGRCRGTLIVTVSHTGTAIPTSERSSSRVRFKSYRRVRSTTARTNSSHGHSSFAGEHFRMSPTSPPSCRRYHTSKASNPSTLASPVLRAYMEE